MSSPTSSTTYKLVHKEFLNGANNKFFSCDMYSGYAVTATYNGTVQFYQKKTSGWTFTQKFTGLGTVETGSSLSMYKSTAVLVSQEDIANDRLTFFRCGNDGNWKQTFTKTYPGGDSYGIGLHTVSMYGNKIVAGSGDSEEGNPVLLYYFKINKNGVPDENPKTITVSSFSVTVGSGSETISPRNIADVSMYGNNLVIGCPGSSSSDDGAAIIFNYDQGNDTWTQDSEFKDTLRATGQQNYGSSVSMYGLNFSVGSPGEKKVYAYTITSSSDINQYIINAPAEAAGQAGLASDYGYSVRMYSTYLIVSDPVTELVQVLQFGPDKVFPKSGWFNWNPIWITYKNHPPGFHLTDVGNFGQCVAIYGQNALVTNSDAINNGQLFFYTRNT